MVWSYEPPLFYVEQLPSILENLLEIENLLRRFLFLKFLVSGNSLFAPELQQNGRARCIIPSDDFQFFLLEQYH